VMYDCTKSFLRKRLSFDSSAVLAVFISLIGSTCYIKLIALSILFHRGEPVVP